MMVFIAKAFGTLPVDYFVCQLIDQSLLGVSHISIPSSLSVISTLMGGGVNSHDAKKIFFLHRFSYHILQSEGNVLRRKYLTGEHFPAPALVFRIA